MLYGIEKTAVIESFDRGSRGTNNHIVAQKNFAVKWFSQIK